MNEYRKTKSFICENCQKEFIARADHKYKFCSRKCTGEYQTKTRKIHKVCPNCNVDFIPTRNEHVCCSRKCSAALRKTKIELSCELCGKRFERWESTLNNKHYFCSGECSSKYRSIYGSGENSKLWKGGKKESLGYIFVYDSKNFRESPKYKQEHRIVMENHLGFPIPEGMVVHHKDLNKSNNDICNLELMTKSEHAKLHKELTCIKAVINNE